MALVWYDQWLELQDGQLGDDINWEEFKEAFLDRFFPLELREAMVQEFINLKQGNSSVREYALKFTKLSKYAPFMVANPKAQMSKFISGVSSMVSLECKFAMMV